MLKLLVITTDPWTETRQDMDAGLLSVYYHSAHPDKVMHDMQCLGGLALTMLCSV